MSMLYSDLKLHKEPGSLQVSAQGAAHAISINTNSLEVRMSTSQNMSYLLFSNHDKIMVIYITYLCL